MNYNNVNPRGLPRPHDGNGRIFHKVDRWYPSSQTCSQCGFKNSETKDLRVRKWICPECGTNHDRDINAATNILNQGIKEVFA